MAHNICKKIITAVLCTMLVMCMGIAVSAFGDTAGNWAEKEINFISSYGIISGYEDGNFHPDNAITRAEAVTVALRMLKLDGTLYGNDHEPTFSDVPSDHWAFSAIETAVSLKIVNGDPAGTFRPGDLVSYQEMTKIMVSMLGCELQAQSMGGWPNGYMSVAVRKDLFQYGKVNAADSASRAAVAVMAYNTLQASLTEAVTYSDGNVEFKDTGRTLLDIYFNAQIKEGILTATHITALNGESVDYGKISIDNTVYFCDGDYTELLGNQVRYSYKEEDGIKKVVYVIENPVKQKKEVVYADDAELLEGVYTSNGKFIYFRTGKTKKAVTLKLSGRMSLIYNNQYIPYTDMGDVELNIAEGSYELIDYDYDSLYDCVKILSYKDYYVNNTSISDDKKYITDGKGNSLIYDIEEDEIYEKITFNKSRISFEDIASGDIISAAVSPDTKKVEIIVSRNVIDGEIIATAVENGETVLTIGESDYNVSQAPADDLKAELKAAGKFYLNAFGDVTYIVEESDNGENYGYLSRMGKKSGIRNNVEIMMLTTENTFVTLNVAEKVKYYNEYGALSTITPDEFYEKFKPRDFDDDPTNDPPNYRDPRNVDAQVVKYKLNSDGELALIRVASNTPSTTEFSVGYVNPDNGETEGRRYYSNYAFEQKCKITDDTVLFRIPWTYEGEDYTRYRSGKASKFLSEGNYYQVKIFDVDEKKEIGAVMLTLYGQEKEIVYDVSTSSPVMVVDSVNVRIDKETGDETMYVSGIVNGEYTSVPFADEYRHLATGHTSMRGAVIQYGTNSSTLQSAYYEGETPGIAAITTLNVPGYSKKRILFNGGNVEMPSASKKTTYGTVKDVIGFTVTVSVPDYVHYDSADYFMDEDVLVIIVDKDENKLDIGSFYDIRPGDEIFIRQRYNKIKEVVLYR